MPAKKPHYDDVDVPAALERETFDGPGFDTTATDPELPESDFSGYSEDSDSPVENDHDGDNVGTDEEDSK